MTATGAVHRLPSGGPPVGAWADSVWPQSAIELAPGDSLVVVSDGVLDVFDSVESFTQAVYSAAHGQASAQSASDAILALAPAETAEDDVTVVVVRRLPQGVAA
jgi:sigma-B regulation protein RsbU (phosphoserine phosphatase)